MGQLVQLRSAIVPFMSLMGHSMVPECMVPDCNRLLLLGAHSRRQALKTTLNYLSETNGELHFFLHNYVSEHPLPLDGKADPDEWLTQVGICQREGY